MGRDRATLRRLLDLLADVAGDVLSFQIASGAQAVQLFDTWAGELAGGGLSGVGPPRGRPRAIAGIRRPPGAPVILYVNGCGHLLEAMAESGADVLSHRLARIALRGAPPPAGRSRSRGTSTRGSSSATRRRSRRRTRGIVAETRRATLTSSTSGTACCPGSRLDCVEAFFDGGALAGRPRPDAAEVRA